MSDIIAQTPVCMTLFGKAPKKQEKFFNQMAQLTVKALKLTSSRTGVHCDGALVKYQQESLAFMTQDNYQVKNHVDDVKKMDPKPNYQSYDVLDLIITNSKQKDKRIDQLEKELTKLKNQLSSLQKDPSQTGSIQTESIPEQKSVSIIDSPRDDLANLKVAEGASTEAPQTIPTKPTEEVVRSQQPTESQPTPVQPAEKKEKVKTASGPESTLVKEKIVKNKEKHPATDMLKYIEGFQNHTSEKAGVIKSHIQILIKHQLVYKLITPAQFYENLTKYKYVYNALKEVLGLEMGDTGLKPGDEELQFKNSAKAVLALLKKGDFAK